MCFLRRLAKHHLGVDNVLLQSCTGSLSYLDGKRNAIFPIGKYLVHMKNSNKEVFGTRSKKSFAYTSECD
jgi:hypothetical protein